ncbi:hypothetical protein 20Sep418_00043 [Pseudomonas phage 20Sep418]|uniref:Uncharacterized protein n=1 Tax=Pseudomonas phage Baskent_P3_3B TaxID=3145033 RepID=A0AAU8BC35_9CAUD|nr:hypothetical protein 9081_00103 [Pseudomonas phage bmx-p3]WFG37719.1 hypothetical protein 20Sep418_00043 [Pseudomonas phage 20Sep418]
MNPSGTKFAAGELGYAASDRCSLETRYSLQLVLTGE